MQTTIYIRKENEEFWESLGKDKSKWVNEQLQGGDSFVKSTKQSFKVQTKKDSEDYSLVPPEPTYETVAPVTPQTPVKAPKLKVLTNDDLKALLANSDRKPIQDEPRHVCKDNCKHWVWDVDKGGRVNTLTGEFQEGSPW